MKQLLKTTNLFLLIFFVVVFLNACTSKQPLKNKSALVATDSTDFYITQSEQTSLNFNEQHHFLEHAYQLTENTQDTVKNQNLLKIAYQTYLLNDSIFFKKVNSEALLLSEKLHDSAAIADAHWNYGNFFVDKEVMDSAYYHYNKAYNNFRAIQNEYYSGKILFNMAFIQGRLHNPIESEILTYNAITKFEPLNKNSELYECYNHLGLIYLDINDYSKALDANNKALDYLKKIGQKGISYEKSLNNIGLVYEQKGDYKKAVVNFNKALENDSLKFKDINFYAILIDNLAYNQFKSGDTAQVLNKFNKALKIRDSLNNNTGITIGKLHMAEYYAANKDKPKALNLVKEALNLATQVNNNGYKLSSLKLLSKIDTLQTSTYLKTYIAIKDSLLIKERTLQNKFTRIQFETDTYIKETDFLTKQRLWIILISTITLSILSLLYIGKRQQARKKELAFEKHQQRTNEQIYGLIIEKQAKLEEGRLNERNRIAEELHDGILGKLFGTRMNLGFLDLKGDDKNLQKFDASINELQNIEKEIRTISHALKNDLLASQSNFMIIVEDLINNQDTVSGFTCNLTSDKTINWANFNDNIKINLYRIIQEALQNINKHAKATKVFVDFSMNNSNLILKIQDDGLGFDIKKTKSGIGLKNIRSRVEKISGTLTIRSTINKGTTIIISTSIA